MRLKQGGRWHRQNSCALNVRTNRMPTGILNSPFSFTFIQFCSSFVHIHKNCPSLVTSFQSSFFMFIVIYLRLCCVCCCKQGPIATLQPCDLQIYVFIFSTYSLWHTAHSTQCAKIHHSIL